MLVAQAEKRRRRCASKALRVNDGVSLWVDHYARVVACLSSLSRELILATAIVIIVCRGLILNNTEVE